MNIYYKVYTSSNSCMRCLFCSTANTACNARTSLYSLHHMQYILIYSMLYIPIPHTVAISVAVATIANNRLGLIV